MVFKTYGNYQSLLLILMLFLSGITDLYSQKFTVGVKAGATLTDSRFGDKGDKDQFTNSWKPGFFGAGIFNFPMKKNFSLQTEAGFSQRGRIIKFNEDTWSNNANYQFIDAAIIIRKSYPLHWSKNVSGTWFFNIGPKISYWLNGNGNVSTATKTIDPGTGAITIEKGYTYPYTVKFSPAPENPNAQDINTMYLTDVNRWLFGIDLGIGVDVPTTSSQRLVFELRFTSGQTFYGTKGSAFNSTPGFTDNLRSKEKIISFSVAYVFHGDLHDSKKGKSTQKDLKKSSKPRKNIDSMIH